MGNFNKSWSLRRKISLFLDNELPKDIRQEFEQSIESDLTVGRIINKEKDFKEYIKNNIRRPEVSPQLVESIKSKIRQ
jgi:hypothetical protein